MSHTLTKLDLRQFTGSERFIRHPIARRVIWTEGVNHVAETGGAYWLIDEIAFAVSSEPSLTGKRFHHWKLTVTPDHKATLSADNGNYQQLYIKQIEWTDFPLDVIEFYTQQNEFGRGNFTLMLPSEY